MEECDDDYSAEGKCKPKQVENLKKFLTSRGFGLHESVGEQHTIIGLVGDTSKLDIDLLSSLDVVEAVRRIQEPYKNANRKFHAADTVVDVGGAKIGGGHFMMIAGPARWKTTIRFSPLRAT